jgi:microsomal dipeptidase-like Zn-dependent dipeptidase
MKTRWLPLLLALPACDDEVVAPVAPGFEDAFGLALGCFSVEGTDPGSGPAFLTQRADGQGFTFEVGGLDEASRFFFKPADLGTYLLYDADGGYVVSEGEGLLRQQKLLSDILTIDDSFVSGAEWEFVPSTVEEGRFAVRHVRTGGFLTTRGVLAPSEAGAAVLALHPREGCAEHPEMSLDAQGEVTKTTFDDGAVYGIVDTHSHILTNVGFGGGGVFHGAPFHRLGVEHALPDCSLFHGAEGRQDMLGFAYDQGTEGNFDVEVFLPALLFGTLPAFNHHTDGWPTFTTWPAAPFSSTHQTQYWRWLERAYKGGLRLVVLHGTSNSVMCDLLVGQGIQQVRYGCNDMVAIDRTIVEAYNMERYVDAHAGGPGEGWFRIVRSPAEARAVIEAGKLAVVLGIETSNLFDCLMVTPEGGPVCDEAFVKAELDHYFEQGVRAIFPTHKYDNQFSAGDGHRAISEVGNFANSGHFSSFTLDCPPDATPVFDRGNVQFGGLNQPREDFLAPPPNDMSGFAEAPIDTLLPFLEYLQSPPLEGEYCQSHGLTPLGETLIVEMMRRGMIVEIDHLPQWSYQRAFDLLDEMGYPAVATHGSDYNGAIYENAGLSKMNFRRCVDPAVPGAMVAPLAEQVARTVGRGGYPSAGFGFDLNGFAGAPGPRFGDRAGCDVPQENPITYPFTSLAGDVTFTQPRVGERTIDFNTEGMAHVGLLPELIEDARRTGATEADLEPLFRSAEGYIRMWERAEERSSAIP